MTQRQMITQIFERMAEVVGGEDLDIGAVRQALNLAYQYYYPISKRTFSWFYNKKQTFSTTTALSKASDFDELRTILAPTAFRGTIRVTGHREFDELNNNTVQEGTTDSPTAVENETVIEIDPTTAGDLIYGFNFGFISDDTREITEPNATALALIHPLYEEDVIMYAIHILRLRQNETDQVPASAVDEALSTFVDSEKAIENMKAPETLFQIEVPIPV